MQIIIEGIRKIVVLVFLMELVLQMQSGKQYEPYIKMLVGIMVVYSLVTGLFAAFGSLDKQYFAPMQDFKWSDQWFAELEENAEEYIEDREEIEEYDNVSLEDTIRIEEIKNNISIEKITVSPMGIGNKKQGDMP